MKQERSNRPDSEASLRHAALGRPLARLAVAAAVVAAVLGTIDAGLFYWTRAARVADSTVLPQRLAPREPGVRAAEAPAKPPSYRWVNRSTGIAEIPVERAMRVLAVDGGAAQPPSGERPAPQPAPSAAPRSGDAAAPEHTEPQADESSGRAPIPGVGFAPPLGGRVDVAATVNDEDGRRVALGALLHGVSLVVPAYYRCPNLCDLTLDGVAELAASATAAGAPPADVLLVSFADDETPDDARAMRTELSARHPEIAGDPRWHFLTASAENVARVTRSIGFRFERPAGATDYAHAVGAVVVAGDGRLLAFLPGVRFAAERLVALVAGRPAADDAARAPPAVLLWCFHYDPRTGRYSFVILRALQAAVAVCIAAVLLGIVALNRRNARRKRGT
jgi:protein SCO1/2